jgi:hypothetical protein
VRQISKGGAAALGTGHSGTSQSTGSEGRAVRREERVAACAAERKQAHGEARCYGRFAARRQPRPVHVQGRPGASTKHHQQGVSGPSNDTCM